MASSEPDALYAGLLNTAKGFWEVYGWRPGSIRRKALKALFQKNPEARLPVNNRWQANTCDPDLTALLKKGVLSRVRDGGGRRHPMNRRSGKRQTYLVLASTATVAETGTLS